MANSHTKLATPLVLLMTSGDTQSSTTFVPGKCLDTNGSDLTAEKDLVGCTELLEDRPATREVTDMISAKKETEEEHRNNDEMLECKQCGRVFKYKKSFGKHVCENHTRVFKEHDRMHECTHCGRVFKYKTNLEKHVATEHRTGEKMHECKKCGQMFFCQLHLHQHLFKEHIVAIDIDRLAMNSAKKETEKEPDVDRMVVVSLSKAGGRYHRPLVMSGSSDLWRCCCGWYFGNAQVAMADLEVAKQSSALPCRNGCFNMYECKKVFQCKQVHECKPCGKVFKSKYHFDTHMYNKHRNDAKMNECKKCGQVFLSQFRLRQHLLREHVVAIDNDGIAMISAKKETEKERDLDGLVVVSLCLKRKRRYHQPLVMSGPSDLWRCCCNWKFGNAQVAIADLEVAKQIGAMKCSGGCFEEPNDRSKRVRRVTTNRDKRSWDSHNRS